MAFLHCICICICILCVGASWLCFKVKRLELGLSIFATTTAAVRARVVGIALAIASHSDESTFNGRRSLGQLVDDVGEMREHCFDKFDWMIGACCVPLFEVIGGLEPLHNRHTYEQVDQVQCQTVQAVPSVPPG